MLYWSGMKINEKYTRDTWEKDMSEKSMSKDTRKNVILLHIAVMCFSCSGVIGQYVQVPAVQVAMGRVICSSLLLLAISLVCKDKLTLDSKKDYGLMILTGVVMAIHWSSFFQSIQTSSVAIGTITFSTFPLFLTFLEPLLFHEKICGKNILNALILLMGVLITIPEFSVENKVTIGILWGMLASFTYAVMTLSNRYFFPADTKDVPSVCMNREQQQLHCFRRWYW